MLLQDDDHPDDDLDFRVSRKVPSLSKEKRNHAFCGGTPPNVKEKGRGEFPSRTKKKNKKKKNTEDDYKKKEMTIGFFLHTLL
jgi:hypothetical protein